jgi:hypothetical protein
LRTTSRVAATHLWSVAPERSKLAPNKRIEQTARSACGRRQEWGEGRDGTARQLIRTTLGLHEAGETVTFSDQARQFAAVNFVEPAREAGERLVEIAARDVHDGIRLENRFPLVCSALQAAVFSEQHRIQLVSIDGPCPSSTTVFRFSVLP